MTLEPSRLGCILCSSERERHIRAQSRATHCFLAFGGVHVCHCTSSFAQPVVADKHHHRTTGFARDDVKQRVLGHQGFLSSEESMNGVEYRNQMREPPASV
jgi:hypothetical protein